MGLEDIIKKFKRKIKKTAIIGTSLAVLIGYNVFDYFLNKTEAQTLNKEQIHQENLAKVARINEAQQAKAGNVTYIFVDSAAAPGGNGSALMPYNNLNDAFLNAVNNTRIYVGKGTYTANQINVPADSIEVYGVSRKEPTGENILTTIVGGGFSGGSHYPAIWVKKKGIIFKNFNIKSTNTDFGYGICVDNGELYTEKIVYDGFRGNVIVTNSGELIRDRFFGFTHQKGGDALVTGSGSKLIDMGGTSIGALGVYDPALVTSSGTSVQDGATYIADSNVKINHGGAAIGVNNFGEVILLYNDIWNNGKGGGDYYNVPPGSNDIFVDPRFIGGEHNKVETYRLSQDSPLRNAGNPSRDLSLSTTSSLVLTSKLDADGTPPDIGYFPHDSLYIALIDTIVNAGTLTIPLFVTNVDFLSEIGVVYSWEGWLRYDPSKLRPIQIGIDKTLSAGMMMEYNLDEISIIKIAAAGKQPIAGKGPLAYATFDVISQIATVDTLNIEEFYINETKLKKTGKQESANMMALQNMAQENNEVPLALRPTIIRIEPYIMYGDADLDGIISAIDASLILKYRVKMIELTLEQLIRADVSGVMGVTAYDAALILQHNVGSRDKFPVELKKNPLNKNIELLVKKEEKDGFVDYHLNVKDIDVYAMQLAVNYDKNSLRFENVNFKNIQVNDNGRTYIALASAEPINGDITLRYRKTGENTNISLEDVMVNEEKVNVKNIPREYMLFQNYPNPFNPETEIQYSVPEETNIKLNIYNLLGQKVKTLADQREEPGKHSVKWDGTNEFGQKVASGIYFYKLETNDFISTKKMILIK